MKRYKISGERKREDTKCLVCKNGAIFKGMPKTYKTDEFSKDYDTHICGVCDTLYKNPRIILDFPIESNGEDITEETINEFDLNIEVINEQNLGYFVLKIKQGIDAEVKEMWDKILAEREDYNEIGLHNHIWITSRPFKTAEGTFQIKNCPVCKMATINYKGKVYLDTLSKILNFIAQQGIKHEQEASFLPVF